jgi:hypothetical protein
LIMIVSIVLLFTPSPTLPLRRGREPSPFPFIRGKVRMGVKM